MIAQPRCLLMCVGCPMPLGFGIAGGGSPGNPSRSLREPQGAPGSFREPQGASGRYRPASGCIHIGYDHYTAGYASGWILIGVATHLVRTHTGMDTPLVRFLSGWAHFKYDLTRVRCTSGISRVRIGCACGRTPCGMDVPQVDTTYTCDAADTIG